MGKVVPIFALTIFLGSCLAQFAEFNVTYTDMNVPMKLFAIGQTLLLLSDGTDPMITADKLVSVMNTKYGDGWFYRLGPNVGFKGLTPEKNSTLQFQIKSTQVTIQKLSSKANNPNLMNLEEIIKVAKDSKAIKIEGDSLGQNQTNYNIFTSIAKEVLSSNNEECVNINSTAQQEICLNEISLKLYNLVPKNLIIVSEVGLFGHYFSYANNDAYAFKMGDLYFIIRLIKDTNLGPIFIPPLY